jgi:diazepam-binding inhibitor (GABA receptor modulating acyl-CoA-binding protein)
MSIEEQFKLGVDLVNNLRKIPTDDELLKLYGLYKQSTIGNCNKEQPNIFYIKERKKWNAWNSLKNMDKNTAMEKYRDLALSLCGKYGNI